ncbi:MAG: mechanosensitive ion channel family protein [Sulfurovum sp.]|uniref:mechanosensitive ion channel family protein n=1 Tax=Sulfurovum sp. TaxID=1969726 RepID=UPI003C717ADE
MKKIIFLLIFLSTSFLFSNDVLDDFINEQVKIESQLLDQNLSLEKKIEIKDTQDARYQKFLLEYAANKEEYLQQSSPYKREINKLKLRLNSNKYRGYTNAVMRDEVLIKSYNLRNGIREAFHEVMLLTESESKSFFKDKINETLVKYFSKFTPLDENKYISDDQDKSNPIIKSLNKALKDLDYLENVANTFSAELVANSAYIYRTGRLSKSHFFTFLKKINTSDHGKKINTYLSPYNLNIASILFVIALIIIIIVSNIVLRFIIDRTLKYYKFEEEDIAYIHTHITKIFKMITSLLVIHLILIVYMGLDITSINMSKLFSIAYVVLVAIALYRITNTIAYIKMESLKSSMVLRNEVINLSIKVSNSVIILMAAIAILKILGVNLTALLSGLGIAGAAVAFAAKDSIANIFGSVSILLGDVFEQGDWIETNDVNGTVVEIGLRASTIRTFDNALISIPNFELANKGVKNWSRRSIGRRIKMNVGVTYESNFDDIRQAIDDIRAMLKEHPGIANEHTNYQHSYRQAKLVSMDDFKGVKRTSLVYMDEFAESSINILVYCFSRSVVWNEWLEVKEDVMFKIAEILKKNNLEFAYPALTLHHVEKANRPDIDIST